MFDVSSLDPIDAAIDALYFARRRYLAGADSLLRERDLNRAHHRVLHFIARHPGVSVSGLCEILGISKQALHAPLRRLLDDGLVQSRVGGTDRRVRELHLTASGASLQTALNDTMRAYLTCVFDAVGPEKQRAWAEVTVLMADPCSLDEQGAPSRD